MRHALRTVFAALLLGGLASAPAGAAEHVRGQVTAIAGDTATVATPDGRSVAIALKPGFTLIVYRPIALADLKPGDWLSIPSVTAPDGRKQALSIGVFPAALHGVGEGESGWDRGPGSAMTNAAFASMAAQGPDHTILVSWKGRQETVEVPASAPILALEPTPDRRLAVGDRAIFFATEDGDTLAAARAGVMADGSAPPM